MLFSAWKVGGVCFGTFLTPFLRFFLLCLLQLPSFEHFFLLFSFLFPFFFRLPSSHFPLFFFSRAIFLSTFTFSSSNWLFFFFSSHLQSDPVMTVDRFSSGSFSLIFFVSLIGGQENDFLNALVSNVLRIGDEDESRVSFGIDKSRGDLS